MTQQASVLERLQSLLIAIGSGENPKVPAEEYTALALTDLIDKVPDTGWVLTKRGKRELDKLRAKTGAKAT